jgi:hypothetical protein
MHRLPAGPAVLTLLLLACGGRTAPDTSDPVPDWRLDGFDDSSAGAGGSAGEGGASGGGAQAGAGGIAEYCYRPGTNAPALPCLGRDDPSLGSLFASCPHPALIASDPLTDYNTTTGVVRCCYDISTETCQ